MTLCLPDYSSRFVRRKVGFARRNSISSEKRGTCRPPYTNLIALAVAVVAIYYVLIHSCLWNLISPHNYNTTSILSGLDYSSHLDMIPYWEFKPNYHNVNVEYYIQWVAKKVAPPLKYRFWYIKFRKFKNSSEIIMILTTYIAKNNIQALLLLINMQKANNRWNI